MATDPVCKMEVGEATAPGKFQYSGKTYSFCATGCKVDFRAPKKYAEQG